MGDADEQRDLPPAAVQVVLGLGGVAREAVHVHVLRLALAHVDQALVVGRVVRALEVVQLPCAAATRPVSRRQDRR